VGSARSSHPGGRWLSLHSADVAITVPNPEGASFNSLVEKLCGKVHRLLKGQLCAPRHQSRRRLFTLRSDQSSFELLYRVPGIRMNKGLTIHMVEELRRFRVATRTLGHGSRNKRRDE
jgi:hypothetical protein